MFLKQNKSSIETMNRKVKIIYLGCTRRNLEIDFNIYFKKNSYVVAHKLKEADYIVVVTCAFTKEREDATVNFVNNIIKEKKKQNAQIIIAGCLPKINPERFACDEDIVQIYNKKQYDEIFGRKYSICEAGINHCISEIYNDIYEKGLGIYRNILNCFYNYISTNRVRHFAGLVVLLLLYVWLKIKRNPIYDVYYLLANTGCDGKCTYCIAKHAVGKTISRALEKIMQDLELGYSLGFRHFKLTSDDLKFYGLDIGSSALDLLNRLASFKGEYILDIECVNPGWIVDNISQFLEIAKKIKLGIVVSPIQSGSQRILNLMKREYQIEEVKQCFKTLIEQCKGLRIRTAIMVGFPSEADEDFLKTIEFLRSTELSGANIYKYSDRPGTLSFHMENKLPESTKIKRLNIAKKFLSKSIANQKFPRFVFDRLGSKSCDYTYSLR
jgi:tRNA A37 methylthiotransferase MiaB